MFLWLRIQRLALVHDVHGKKLERRITRDGEPAVHPDMLSEILVEDVDRDGRDDAIVVTQSRVHLLRGQP